MSAAEFLPRIHSLSRLKAAAQNCRGCALYATATQTVFGAGRPSARLALLGEQPGDQEDRAGAPFVGPAGRVLDEALEEAGIKRTDVYLTNAVKHFKWEPRGKRRLHKKPASRELAACRPWWDAELEAVRPEGVICLGATASQFVLGKQFRLTRNRGNLLSPNGSGGHPFWVLATWHPSAILRAPHARDRSRMQSELVHDLGRAKSLLHN